MTDIKQQKQQLKELLKIHYGFEKFRPGQERAIDNILNGEDTIVIMPTGGGKSLIYQLPSLVLDGVTIVISPLISLMKDQVDSLGRVGIPATFINSSVSPDELANRIEKVKTGYYKLLYIAPERFYNQEFINTLKKIKVSLFAIDEAHCISQWGHDFRPSYLKMREAIELAGSPPVVALTATATPEVKEDIIKQLKLENPKKVITGFARPNLQFGSIQTNDAQKIQLAYNAIMKSDNGSGIIYTGTRSRADDIAQTLVAKGVEAIVYHAGLDASNRQWVQENFMSGKSQVVVATNAFGLGIDKKDIRFVIHYDMPGTVEAYYQEAGRAGRDGRPSFCLLLYSARDRYLHEFFIKGDNPPPSIILEIYEVLLGFESDTVLVTYSDLADMLTEKIPDMAIGTSLKILEREGYISRPNEKVGSAFLKLLNSTEVISEAIGKRAKVQNEIWNKLTSKFLSEMEKGWQFSPEEVAALFDVKKESLMRLVRSLAEKALVEYNPPFKGTEIRILKKENSENINIDFSAMKHKLKHAFQKLDKMEDYIYHFDCRQKYILDYFGDKEAKACGKCDNCLSDTGYSRKHERPDRQNRKFKTKSKKSKYTNSNEEYEVKAPSKKSSLNTKLTQLETLDLHIKGLSIKKIAKERELTIATVIQHLCFLIEKKLIKNIDKLVDRKNQTKIEKAIKKVGAEKLRPIHEYLNEEVNYDDIRIVMADMKRQA